MGDNIKNKLRSVFLSINYRFQRLFQMFSAVFGLCFFILLQAYSINDTLEADTIFSSLPSPAIRMIDDPFETSILPSSRTLYASTPFFITVSFRLCEAQRHHTVSGFVSVFTVFFAPFFFAACSASRFSLPTESINLIRFS